MKKSLLSTAAVSIVLSASIANAAECNFMSEPRYSESKRHISLSLRLEVPSTPNAVLDAAKTFFENDNDPVAFSVAEYNPGEKLVMSLAQPDDSEKQSLYVVEVFAGLREARALG